MSNKTAALGRSYKKKLQEITLRQDANLRELTEMGKKLKKDAVDIFAEGNSNRKITEANNPGIQ